MVKEEEKKLEELKIKCLDDGVFITSEINDDYHKYVCKNLYEYNVKVTNGLLNKPGINISLYLKEENGNVIGGILCNTFSLCLYVDVLWIDEKYRSKGHGKDLILEAENIAREKGCIFSHTCTFSYQNPNFYQKMGFEIFGVIDEYPDQIKQYFLKKRL